MQKKFIACLSSFLLAAFLVACGGGGDFNPSTVISVETAHIFIPDRPLATINESALIKVTVPRSLPGDLVVFEAVGQGIDRIVVYDSNMEPIAGSRSKLYFYPASSTQGVQVTGETVSSAIRSGLKCIGPCVVLEQPSSTDTFYVNIYARGTTEFFSYASDYDDSNEPAWNSKTNPATLVGGAEVFGAFETLFDEDYYQAADYMNVELSLASGSGWSAGLMMTVDVSKDAGRTWNPISSQSEWGSIFLAPSDMLRLATAGGFAGSSNASQYVIRASPVHVNGPLVAEDFLASPLALPGSGVVKVDVPTTLIGDFVIMEVAGNQLSHIIIRDSGGNILGGSNSPNYFFAGTESDVLAPAAAIKQQAIAVAKCLGPCFSVEHTGSSSYFFVEAYANGPIEFFAYSGDYYDPHEPGNDTLHGAVLLPNSSALGAFETLGDVDYYEVARDSYVTIDLENGTGWGAGLTLRVEILNQGSHQWIELDNPSDWKKNYMVSGTKIRLSTVDGRAGVGAASSYRIITEDN